MRVDKSNRHAVVTLLLSLLCLSVLLSSCTVNGNGYNPVVHDVIRAQSYYGGWFETPFKANRHRNVYGDVLFDSELDIEVMQSRIEGVKGENGLQVYTTQFFDINGTKRLFIVRAENTRADYWCILGMQQKTRESGADDLQGQYMLTGMTWGKTAGLFPVQFCHDIEAAQRSRDSSEVLCTFEEFLRFYEDANRDDFKLDFDKKIIWLSVRYSYWAKMSFVEVDNGNNYVEFLQQTMAS